MSHETERSDVSGLSELRVLVVGRSPSVLLEAVERLRAGGCAADATNQFDRVLEEYDLAEVDILVFGGMVPPDFKERLRAAAVGRNPRITVVQGLAGIAGVIAAQVAAVASAGAALNAAYDEGSRSVRVALHAPERVVVEAFWGTSFVPPEPRSASAVVRDEVLAAGTHEVALPAEVPAVASWVSVTAGEAVRIFTIGPIPDSVRRMVPRTSTDHRLPAVAPVSTGRAQRA